MCDFWRILVIEGEDCTLILVDTYEKGSKGNAVLVSPEVTVYEDENSISIKSDGSEEIIYKKVCVRDPNRVNKIIEEIMKELGVERCTEE